MSTCVCTRSKRQTAESRFSYTSVRAGSVLAVMMGVPVLQCKVYICVSCRSSYEQHAYRLATGVKLLLAVVLGAGWYQPAGRLLFAFMRTSELLIFATVE